MDICVSILNALAYAVSGSLMEAPNAARVTAVAPGLIGVHRAQASVEAGFLTMKVHTESNLANDLAIIRKLGRQYNRICAELWHSDLAEGNCNARLALVYLHTNCTACVINATFPILTTEPQARDWPPENLGSPEQKREAFATGLGQLLSRFAGPAKTGGTLTRYGNIVKPRWQLPKSGPEYDRRIREKQRAIQEHLQELEGPILEGSGMIKEAPCNDEDSTEKRHKRDISETIGRELFELLNKTMPEAKARERVELLYNLTIHPSGEVQRELNAIESATANVTRKALHTIYNMAEFLFNKIHTNYKNEVEEEVSQDSYFKWSYRV